MVVALELLFIAARELKGSGVALELSLSPTFLFPVKGVFALKREKETEEERNGRKELLPALLFFPIRATAQKKERKKNFFSGKPPPLSLPQHTRTQSGS